MRVIHVLRKPLSEGTVASNVLKHGCGGLNIDASRITTDDNLNGGAYAENASARHDGAENWRYKRGEQGNAGEYRPPPGRWPDNVILQHLDGCRCERIKKVKGSNNTTGVWGGRSKETVYDGGWIDPDQQRAGYTDKDGKESVVNWICVEGCPVAGLDEQTLSNGMHGAGAARRKTVQGSVESTTYNMGGEREMPRYGDKGGASRFFKQVGGGKDA